MSVRVSQEVAQGLSRELHQITNDANLETLAVVTKTGARVAFFTKTSADASEMSAIAAALLNTGSLAVERLDFETLSDIMIRGSNGFLIIRKLSDRFALVGGTSNISAFTKAASVLVNHTKSLGEILGKIPEEMY